MATQNYIQNDFSHGELDPRLYAGTNLQYYYKSLSKARNVYVRPQGGVKRRHGSVYVTAIPADPGEYKIGSFVFNLSTEFLFVILNESITFYQINEDGSIFNTITKTVTDFTVDRIPDIQFAQNGNLLVFTHQDFAPKQCVYDDTTPDFTVSTITIKNLPTYDFNKDYYSYKFKLSAATVGTSRTLTCDTAVFTNDYVGGTFISLGKTVSEPIGLARIKSVGSATPITTCTVDVIYQFDPSLATATPETPGSDCFLGEPAISATRGWPKCCTFYEDRLILAATVLLPQTIFGSRIGAFNDFDQGDSQDDDAIIYTLSSESYNEIKFLVSNQSLQIFCYDSAFATVQEFGVPITPGNIGIRRQSPYGISDCPPVVADNQTFYVMEGGKAILSFIFDPNTATYTAPNVSLFSAHLVRNPVSSAVLKGDSVEDANYMFFINEEGSLLVYQSLSEQNISAYTLCLTGQDLTNLADAVPNEGKYRQIVNVKNKIFTVVERQINNSTVQYLEKLSYDYYTDSSVEVISPHPTNVMGGLNHLIGQRVSVRGDDRIMRIDPEVNDGKVASDGTITLLDEATSFKAGINVRVLIRSIAANIAGQGLLYKPKKIARFYIDYYESIGIKINGKTIPELEFGTALQYPPQPKTGIYDTHGTEWGQRVYMDITQEEPLPLLIIGFGYEVTI